MSGENMSFNLNTKVRVAKYHDDITQEQIDNNEVKPYEVIEFDMNDEVDKKLLTEIGFNMGGI
jgi:hypothetical protein